MSCSICLSPITGPGNKADPINSGRCCDDCNTFVVMVRYYGSRGTPKTFKDYCFDMYEEGIKFERETTIRWLNKMAKESPEGAASVLRHLAQAIDAMLPHKEASEC